MSTTLDQTRALIAHAADRVYAGTADEARLRGLGERLDQPLRVAIAGRVKAGKSTLLNALVGDRLAPTDAGECTRIVTWYADGHSYQVLAEPVDGPPRQLPFARTDDELRVDLSGLAPESVSRLLVTWPAQGLRSATLIDTPGIGSLAEEVSARTWDLLASDGAGHEEAGHEEAGPEEAGPEDVDTAMGTTADAVLYLLRHLHAGDLEFLQAFHDTAVSRPSPINAIGVLSRADEVGGGRLDSLSSARRVSAGLAEDPTVRRLVQTVVPVAGLLAETGATLTQAEFDCLGTVAALDKATSDRLLLTADRFRNGSPELECSAEEREHLLARFGVFGMRLSVTMLRHRVVTTAPELAGELLRRSGLDEVREVLRTLFWARSDALKSRSALLALEALTRSHPAPGSDQVAGEVERITTSTHAFRELRVLAAIRSGWVTGKPEVLVDAERLVGGSGVQPWQRLGLESDVDDATVGQAAAAALERWQRRAESPMSGHQLVAAARVVIQSCEGMVAALHGWGRYR